MTTTPANPKPAQVGSDMVQVTKDVFYAVINPLDVHPNPLGRWQDPHGYLTEWKMHGGSGPLIGWSYGKQYWVTERLAALGK